MMRFRQAKIRSYKITRIVVSHLGRASTRGRLIIGTSLIPCALGRSGVKAQKREGDGRTPVGTFRVVSGFIRLDRIRRKQCDIPLTKIRAADGWCDDPTSQNYNRLIKLPSALHHEKLMRRDGHYDMLFVLDYNLKPRRISAGSAIFFHLSRDDLTATEGCVAIRSADMLKLIFRLSRRLVMVIR